jgi:cell division protein FtsL
MNLHSARRSRPPVVRGARRRLQFFIASLLLVGSLVVGVVSLQALVSQSSFRMQELSRRSAELKQQTGELQLEVAKLTSPERIQREAWRLGLRVQDPSKVKALVVRSEPAPESGASAQPVLSFSVKALLAGAPR